LLSIIITKPTLTAQTIYRVAHNNVPKFAMMLYGLTVEFKQKEMTVLKSNHS